MNIFLEVKEYLTTRQVAEFYGLQVKRNGFACCPFHEEKHPSMKLDRNYHCFGCGIGGDVIDYVSRMFGLSQYEAVLKLIEEFHLPIQGKVKLDRLQKKQFREVKAEQAHLFRIKDRFKKWCNQTIEKLKGCLLEMEQIGIFLKDQPPEMVFSEDYATLLHAEPVMEYWLDILCFGSIEEKQELFLKGRKEVEEVGERVQTSRKHLMERNRGSLGSGNEYNRRYTG